MSALVWFRRDLRDFDHAALAAALAGGAPVYTLFVFDREILDALPSREDRRVEFIQRSVGELDASLRAAGGGMIVDHGWARENVPRIARALGVDAVHANRDYEPAAIARDGDVMRALGDAGIAFHTHKDHVVFERDEIMSQSGRPFSVFTPYRKAWLARMTAGDLAPHDVRRNAGALRAPPRGRDRGVPSLESIGFRTTDLDALGVVPGMRGGAARLAAFASRIGRYATAREFPAEDGSSRLSVHLRFGTVSVRELAAFAHARALEPDGDGPATWLSELVWRDFYSQLLFHHPRVVAHAFRPELENVALTGDPAKLAAWKAGRTGYPIVDAAMRQLSRTGFMHNRLRMVAASFLVKDLHVDWRLGERHFADLLLDYDLASNNGGWQWAASTGSDAQPWFRIFNPVTQSERFDGDGQFIRRFVPELARLANDEIHAPWKLPPLVQQERGVVIGRDYPPPIVDHAEARAKTLQMFKSAANG